MTALRVRGLHIAHLIETDGPGGAERMVASLAAALQAAGAENLVVAPARGEGWLARELGGTGVRVEGFHLDRPFSPAFARWLGTLLARHRVQLAHSHEFTMAVYGAWAARRAGVPHVFTMHGGRYYAERWRRRIALRVAAAFSASVVAVSQSVAHQLRRDLALRASRIVTIPNGARLTPVAESSLRAELRLAPADRVALAVGNLYSVKGHEFLIEALGRLAQRLPHVHVAIAGRGDLHAPLFERARALGLAERVHFLGLRSDIANILAAADVFVLPSLSEGLPLALIEAMLAGRPIVATAVGEVAAVLDGNGRRAGLLVPPGDAGALAEAVARVLSDPGEAHGLAAAALLRAQDYTLTRMAERYAALYEVALRRG